MNHEHIIFMNNYLWFITCPQFMDIRVKKEILHILFMNNYLWFIICPQFMDIRVKKKDYI